MSHTSPNAVHIPWWQPATPLTPEDWVISHPGATDGSWKEQFSEMGFVSVNNLIDPENVALLSKFYDDIIEGRIDASGHRHDLSGQPQVKGKREAILQVMWPHDYMSNGKDSPILARGLALARHLLGDDIAFDFDMLISKPPGSPATTPWHQDAGYWPELPDKRAVSIWCALDTVTVRSGCMWFAPPPSTTQPDRFTSMYNKLHVHRSATPGSHVLTADFPGMVGVPVPLAVGGATLHSGFTPHFTRGNSTNRPRRAYIMNFRPLSMVQHERSLGFDHGRKGVDAFERVRNVRDESRSKL
eukprot:PhF_6_TR6788/c0_g1_i1/m.9771